MALSLPIRAAALEDPRKFRDMHSAKPVRIDQFVLQR